MLNENVNNCYYLGILIVLFNSLNNNAQTLNFYYGNIHSHTAYSDGNKEGSASYDCPTESYNYAKKSLHFDFLGISEHNHAGAGMSLARYADGLAEANLLNQDGVFVTLYGMEWGTISQGGHVIIYGYNKLIGWEAGNYDIFNEVTDYNGLFQKVARNSTAFAYLAHADPADYDSLLIKPFKATNDSAIIGMAIRSGPAFSTDTTYNNPSTSSYEARYKEALRQGYHVGAGLDHDNHYTTFGRTAQSRLVVLAPSLTNTEIRNAFKNRRMYASDDWNIKVNFTINSQPLGTIFTDSNSPNINVSVSDDDGESVSSIKIYYGIPGSGSLVTLLTSNTSTSSLSYTHNIGDGATYYYYAVIAQPDGNKVFTSPIWYTRNDATPLPIELVSFTANTVDDSINIEWITASEINNDYFIIERTEDGSNFKDIAKVKGNGNSFYNVKYSSKDAPYKNGIFYYRLKQVDFDGKSTFSKLISVDYNSLNFKILDIYPNPAYKDIIIKYSTLTEFHVSIELINIYGTVQKKENYSLSEEGELKIKINDCPNGTYILKVIDLSSYKNYYKKVQIFQN